MWLLLKSLSQKVGYDFCKKDDFCKKFKEDDLLYLKDQKFNCQHQRRGVFSACKFLLHCK